MVRARLLLLLLCLPGLSPALDIENAKRINRSCALCHGIYGQGTPGTMSPRLAGMPKDYLAKELKYYRDGIRKYAPMVVSSSVKNMTDKDIEDISDYLSGIDLHNLDLPKIPEYPNGAVAEGEEMYNDECKFCHRDTGIGKPEKGIPPLAGQYGSYLFSQMKKFQGKARYHDDDPEDETFDDWKDHELDHLVAYITKFPPNGPLAAAAERRDGGEMEGMASMLAGTQLSMQGITSMQSMASHIKAAATEDTRIPSTGDIAGQFRITPTGEIVLNPVNQDLRAVAGLSGDFKITPGGIVFVPK